MGTAAASGFDTSPVNEFYQHIFHFVALLRKLLGSALVPSGLILTDADFGHASIRRITELFAVTTLITDQDFGIQHHWIDQLCPNMIAELGFAQPKAIRHR